mgnify:CR=1 FL=1
MSDKGLFLQNVIAVIWDFDKTLSPEYMQTTLFRHYGVDEKAFWQEVHALPAYYAHTGIHVQPDTCYLGHLLSYVREGRMPDLTNARLRELGAQIPLYPGVPELFDRLTALAGQGDFAEGDLHVEHYVVSTGLAEMIRGSAVAERLAGIWASEFIETPAPPGDLLDGAPAPGPISHIAGLLDHTTKTRALFEINKGVNKLPHISVNDSIPEGERRVPMSHMIYIADGPSDIPCLSVVRKHGGHAYAVYDPASPERFEQVMRLHEDGRVDGCGPADYTAGSHTDLWLQRHVRQIAERIMAERRRTLESHVRQGPMHLDT